MGLPGSVTASFFGKAATTQGATRPASSGSHEDIIEARRERFGPKWIRVLRVNETGSWDGVLMIDIWWKQ